jgi:hypothetical protein
LQKENEELKSKNDILEFRMKQNDKMVICERYRILKQRDNYKQRIDKAIEYINKNIVINFDKVGFDTNQIAGIVVDKLLEILQGGDE